MEKKLHLLFTAYKNAYALMQNRGYRHHENHTMLTDIHSFEALTKTWSVPNNLWILFQKDGKYVDVGFPGSVDVRVAEDVLNHANAGGLMKEDKRSHHVIIIVDEVGTPGATLLNVHRRQPFERNKQKSQPVIEIFYVADMQINPLLHSRQPKIMRLITDEDQKEELRTQLLAAASDKTKKLSEILPIIYFEHSFCVWYDACVGDVFYFVRQDGVPYFRVVKPDPKIEAMGKAGDY
jgi:hypothetical protein